LLLTIFYPKTELHDGAVILRGNQIACAAAVLPLSAAHGLAQRKVGTRHRASMGMSEISDAIVVVVSEESGQIAVANNGRLIRHLDSNRLATILKTFFVQSNEEAKSPRDIVVEFIRNFRKPAEKEAVNKPKTGAAA
jgi:diadenylate cyclase